MKLLITGAAGQLGHDLMRQATTAGFDEVVGTDVADLDLTSGPEVADFFERVRPSVVIHGAAYTAVDAAESHEDVARAVNADASAHVAAAAAAVGAGVIAVSTDYVFAGDATTPYEVDDPTGPLSAYGRTKLAGEAAVRSLLPDASWVVRTAWVWGAGGANFVKTMAALERRHDTITVVTDQVGSPTYTVDLAAGLLELAGATAGVPAGIYHLTNAGTCTKREQAQAVFEEVGADPARVLATTSDAFPSPAPRPAYSVLSGAAWAAAGLTPLRSWRDSLRAAFADPEVAAALRGEPWTAD